MSRRDRVERDNRGTLGSFVEECANKGLIFARVKKSVEVVENKWEILLLLMEKSEKT